MAIVERSVRLPPSWAGSCSTHAETGSDRFYAAAGRTRLGVLPAHSARPDGTLAGGAFYFREL